jgi:hypothetical protein
MDFPTIFDLLDRLSFLRGAPAAAVVLLAAFVAVVAWDIALTRRNGRASALSVSLLVFPALFVLYLVGGLLFIEVLDPRLAVVYVIAGFFVALILLVTGRQVNWGRPPRGLTPEEINRLGSAGQTRTLGRLTIANRALVRLALAVGALAAAWWLARSGALPPGISEGEPYLRMAVLGLAGLGLVGLVTSAEPLPGGVGLLIFLEGFALYYSMVDPSLTMVVALVILQLVVALTASYLAQARYLPVDDLD